MLCGTAVTSCTPRGCVIIKPATSQIALIYDEGHKFWLLPRGKKDVGESLEQAALRETYEESGYHATLLPLYMPTRAPRMKDEQMVTEPFFISLSPFIDPKASYASGKRVGGTCVTSWFVAQVPVDAICYPNGPTKEESDFVTHLVSFEQAIELMKSQNFSVVARTELVAVEKAIELWQRTRAIQSGEMMVDLNRDVVSNRIDRKYWD